MSSDQETSTTYEVQYTVKGSFNIELSDDIDVESALYDYAADHVAGGDGDLRIEWDEVRA